MARPRSETIRRFIVENVDAHPRTISTLVQREYEISRQAVNRHLKILEQGGLIAGTGATRNRSWRRTGTSAQSGGGGQTPDPPARMRDVAGRRSTAGTPSRSSGGLRPSDSSGGAPRDAKRSRRAQSSAPTGGRRGRTDRDVVVRKRLRLTPVLTPERAWFAYLEPLFVSSPRAARRCARYVFQSAVDNAVRHAGATFLYVSVRDEPDAVEVGVRDDGIGLFHSGRTMLDVACGRSLVVASRASEAFAVAAGGEEWAWHAARDTWQVLCGDTEVSPTTGPGTCVAFRLSKHAARDPQEVRDEFVAPGAGAFSRVHVPVAVAVHPFGRAYSRAQARAIGAHLKGRREVLLDFEGVVAVEHAFADELFRVFREKHPGVSFVTLRAVPEVRAAIRAIVGASPATNGA